MNDVVSKNPLEQLYEGIDGSHYVKLVQYDDEIIGIITWDGAHGLHFYNMHGIEAEYRTFGDFSKNAETLEHAISEIDDWVTGIEQEITGMENEDD